MTLPQGVNYRSTAGYVTDGPNEFAQLGTALNYPDVTPQGNTVGFESGVINAVADVDSGVDRRFAGYVNTQSWTVTEYRFDLPAPGDYIIRIAMGSLATTQPAIGCDLYDNNTFLTTLIARKFLPVIGTFHDATDVARPSPADWGANNVAVQITATSTILRFRFPSGSGNLRIQHLSVESASTAAQLAGDATGQSSSSGDLTTEIPLTGAAAVVSTAAGALSVPINLSGAATSISSASGDLTAQITLSGAATAQAIASAGLDTSILFSADAVSSASASGDLTVGSGLSGDATSQAQATGSITTQIQLSAAAIAQALASGDLSTPTSGLSGDASAESSATGILSTGIPLTGDASAVVTGAGDLNTEIKLDGVALNVVSGTGSLTASITLSGTAAALVAAGADLTTQIPLNATALAQALATGFLSSADVVIPKNPGYTIKAKARDYRVAA